jgi:Cysteine-rich CPCC
MAGGANKCSLIEGQQNYALFGACEQQMKPHVHPPKEFQNLEAKWRPLDLNQDRYLKWEHKEDHEFWNRVKNSIDGSFYYWLPTYWYKQNTD